MFSATLDTTLVKCDILKVFLPKLKTDVSNKYHFF